MSSPSAPSELPEFLFNYWQFRKDDISKARDRNDLQGWNVSSLCSAYLKYQLDRHERQLAANSEDTTPSLISVSVGKILENLRYSKDLQADVQYVVETLGVATLRHLLRDPRTPYVMLRVFDASPLSTVQWKDGDRKVVDIDETLIASEKYIRSQKGGSRDGYLVSLYDLDRVHGPMNRDGTLDIKRKTPPKGGFEFLDEKRKSVVKLWANDVRFNKTFDRVTQRILKGLDWDHVFVAGGMVLNTLLHTDPSKDDDKDIAECDIDLYLYDLTPEEANRKVEDIYKVWSTNYEARCQEMGKESETIVIKNAKTINFIPRYPNRRIQIILKLLASPLDILLNFDLDACALGFDGTQVLMLPRCARALETGYSVFTMDLIWGHHLGNRRETQEVRVFKYADRGFGLRILPSYVRSLEQQGDLGVTVSNDIESSAKATTEVSRAQAEGKKEVKGSGPVRIIEGEPGLKTLKRIAYLGKRFVHKFYFEKPNMLVKTLRQRREEREDAEADLINWDPSFDDGMTEDGSSLIVDPNNDCDIYDEDMDEDDLSDRDSSNGDSSGDDSNKENINKYGSVDDADDDLDGDLSTDATNKVSDKADDRPIIRLVAIDGCSVHDGLPDGRNGLGVFELLMRHCEAWRLDAIGQAWYVGPSVHGRLRGY